MTNAFVRDVLNRESSGLGKPRYKRREGDICLSCLTGDHASCQSDECSCICLDE